jgi:HAD superfamily hydrolase (TIGR01509 family)
MKALIWDVDGTLAETERDGHRVAFNQAFELHRVPWYWNEWHYGELLQVTGGRERLLKHMQSRADAPFDQAEREALAQRLHVTKNERYADLVRDGAIPLRPGVLELMEQCRARGVAMAIATTTSRANVAALLSAQLGVRWRDWFRVVLCGEDTTAKKPHPEVYDRAVRALGIEAAQAVAVEDSPNGALAARAAHVPVIVTRSVYFREARFEDVLAIGDALDAVDSWHPAALDSANKPLVGLEDIDFWLAHGSSAAAATSAGR